MGRNARVCMLAAEEDFALRFAPERFRAEFTAFVERAEPDDTASSHVAARQAFGQQKK